MTTVRDLPQRSISDSSVRRPNLAGWIGTVLFLLGLVFIYFLVIRPMVRLSQSSSWRRVPCVIVSSEVTTSTDSDNATTYGYAIRYRYHLDNHDYTGARFDFSLASSSSQATAEATVARYPKGAETICWVDPANPANAVLQRSASGQAIGVVVSGVFVVVGLLMSVFSRINRARRLAGAGAPLTARASGQMPPPVRGYSVAGAASLSSGPVELKPAASRLTVLLVLGTFTLIWDGIVFGVSWKLLSEWTHGRQPLFPMLFMLLFVIIGVVVLIAFLYQLLAFFNPRAILTLARGNLSLGETTELRYRFDGQSDRISRLTIKLEAREEADYQRGTTTATDRNVFLTLPILETTKRLDITSGRRPLCIPAATMHSLKSKNNRVVWSLKVHGDIAGWPDVKDEYSLQIEPPPTAKPASEAAPPDPATAVHSNLAAPIALSLSGGAFLPSSTLRGRLGWELPHRADRIDLRLFWFTSGKGTRDVNIVETQTLEAIDNSGQHDFSFALPPGPYSFSGKLITLSWAVEAVAAPRGGSSRVEFVLSPDGVEVRV